MSDITREKLEELSFSDFDRPSKKNRGKISPFLFVSNIQNLSDETIKNAFLPFGNIDRIIRDESALNSVVVCFINNLDASKNAVENLRGREIQVDPNDPNVKRIFRVEYSVLKNKMSDEERKILQHSSNKKSRMEWPSGLFLVNEFLTLEEEKKLVQELESLPWSTKIGRRVQHYGFEFNYKTKHVDGPEDSKIPAIPDFLKEIIDRMSKLGNPLVKSNLQSNRSNSIFQFSQAESESEAKILQNPIDQVTVNEYLPGQGIAPHIDTHSAFEDGMASLSLDSQSVMEFEHPNGEKVAVYLPRRSLVILTGESRYVWTHGISYRKTDLVDIQDLKQDSDLKQKYADALSRNQPSALIERHKRISLTLRSVRKAKVCDCKYSDNCDSQNSKISLPDRIVDKEEKNSLQLKEEEKLAPTDIEKEFVHKFYNSIAPHFSQTRHSPWPQVEEFIMNQPSNTLGIDVGCGNGRHMRLNPKVTMIGCDVSENLVSIASSKGCETLVADALLLPHRQNLFDFVTCIAVIHHFSTHFHRMRIMKELIRIVKVGGKVMVSAWALEQGHESRRKFEDQDVMVPWKIPKNLKIEVNGNEKEENGKEEVKEEDPKDSKDEKGRIPDEVVQRFCHVFKEGEMEEMVAQFPDVELVDSFFDTSNWCVVIKKLR
eukprot:TRINITY_DN5504_c2_g1_i1.p1 TRINITY_DN5504_c2_g1~~TRINITY_DN5504_c2_g1_i1.p1  ORF type:complete len:658 (-),score=227.09 TRINITY_DN5504_c2_g1_i1:30-2003(-)